MADETMPPEETEEELEAVVVDELPDVESIAAMIGSFPEARFTTHRYASSDVVYHMISVPVSDWVGITQAAFDAGYDTFVDLTAVDHFADAPRFEVVVNIISMTEVERLIITTRVPYDSPTVPTLTGVYVGANFFEREAYDLLGVVFEGHPDLTRILLPDEWVGHPLRKDYDIGAIPVEFKAGSADL
jgi:NADH:ubiquinone oxidoreductase subunit C